jgi:hypothetical protein
VAAAATTNEHSAPIPFTRSFPPLNTTHSAPAFFPSSSSGAAVAVAVAAM